MFTLDSETMNEASSYRLVASRLVASSYEMISHYLHYVFLALLQIRKALKAKHKPKRSSLHNYH